MLQCWHENPFDRPSFTELYTRLDDILSQSSDYICDLENNVRYHPDTSRTFRPSSSPVPIGNRPLPPDPFQVVMKGAPPSSFSENHQVDMPNRCRDFEVIMLFYSVCQKNVAFKEQFFQGKTTLIVCKILQ